ncbi:hypothetical protein ACFL3S_11225 [Gemmatimonadota bacterium]
MPVISRRLALKTMLVGLPLTHACTSKNARPHSQPTSTPSYENPLESLDGLEIHASAAEIVRVGGESVLSLDGLVVHPSFDLQEACVEVEVLAKGSCYPGIGFHLSDADDFELTYAVPHASGQPDAIQYDPIFNGSNTWQIYNGPAFQRSASVPQEVWFTLRVDFTPGRAAVRIDGQPPLVIDPLAHGRRSGRIGLWTYGPALFKNLGVSAPAPLDAMSGYPQVKKPGTISEWMLPGVGIITCEANGVLNLNRYLRPSEEPVSVLHSFHMPASQDVEFGLGFSDELILQLDGETIFQGENKFSGFESLMTRGWIVPESRKTKCHLAAGSHVLSATVRVTEPFGWGLTVTSTRGLSGELHRDR